jgi:hypothetical protein
MYRKCGRLHLASADYVALCDDIFLLKLHQQNIEPEWVAFLLPLQEV